MKLIRKTSFVALTFSACWLSPLANANPETLTLESYLSEVRQKNTAIRGSLETSAGAMARSHEADLLTRPAVFGNWRWSSDGSLANSIIPLEKTISNSFSAGVSQTTSFGLSARLYYSLNYTDLVGVSPAFAPILPATTFNDSRPALELTQSLWRNSLGAETLATQDASLAAAQAVSFAESFRTKLVLADSELSYWRLVLARDTIVISQDNLNRSIKLHEWSTRRLRLHLGDQADVLQAEAALQARKLDLQNALDEEKVASRGFNTARNKESNQVPEILESLDPNKVSSLKAPEKSQFREDVLAAEQQSHASQASSRMGEEKNKPTLEAFGTLALNGRDTTLGPAVSASFGTDRPTFIIGARFMAPLDWSALKANRAGYAREEQGADLAYQRKLFETNREWKDLEARLEESRGRFSLVQKLEKVQKEKLLLEKERLSHGRTTTYQVLLFEMDYALAQLGRIRAEAELLQLIAQMRTFSGANS